MIFIDGKNTKQDLQRLAWYVIPLVASFALGVLSSFRLYEQNSVQNNGTNNLCPIPVVKVICEPSVRIYKIPETTPETGVR